MRVCDFYLFFNLFSFVYRPKSKIFRHTIGKLNFLALRRVIWNRNTKESVVLVKKYIILLALQNSLVFDQLTTCKLFCKNFKNKIKSFQFSFIELPSNRKNNNNLTDRFFFKSRMLLPRG